MKRTKSTLHSIQYFGKNLLSGYHGWGFVRLVFVIAAGIGLGVIWGLVLEREALAAAAERLKTNLPLFHWLPDPFLILMLTPFQWPSLRLFFVPFFAFVLAILLGARYLQDIYNLPSLELCLRYLIACLFGLGYPTMKIGASEEDNQRIDSSYLPEIGGPGYVEIASGYGVAIGRPKATANIYGEGVHFLLRSEKVEEIADLNDQTDTIEAISAFSHEGVSIQLSDIHYGYRLKKSPPTEFTSTSHSEWKPYSFSLQAMRNLMQSRVVTDQGLTDWRSMVKGVIRSSICDFIYQHTVTELLKPSADYNPYADLKKTLQSRAFRERLRKMGTELLWINVGLFDLEKEPFKQEILKTWQPQGSSSRAVSSPETASDSPQSTDFDLAQAELVEEFLSALAHTDLKQNPVQKIHSLLSSLSSSNSKPKNNQV